MEIRFDVYFKKNLGTLCKDNEVDLDGKEAYINLDLSLVDRLEVNYSVGVAKYTDEVTIKDIDNKEILIPFKSDVVKKGLNEFEIVAYMKNGDIKTSQTYTYEVEEAIGEGKSVSDSNHIHTNLTILNTITQNKIDEWDNKADATHSHSEYASKNHTHNANEIEGLDNIDIDLSSYYTKSETYNKIEIDSKIANMGAGGSVDLSNYYTKSETDEAMNDKANKVHTHNEYLTEHQDISHLALKTELHGHTNKTVLDGITSAKITSWDNKSTFNGDYNSLTNKPTIPSIVGLASETYVNEEIKKIDVTSQLGDYAKKSDIPVVPTKISAFSNDKGYLTSVPGEYVTEAELNSKGYLTEHQDLSNYATKSDIKGVELDVKNKLAEIDSTITVNIASSVEEMVDTEKLYVLESTQTWWKCGTLTMLPGSILPNVDNALSWSTTKISLNKRLTTNGTESDAPGSAVFYFNFNQASKISTKITFTPTSDTYKYLVATLILSDSTITTNDISNYSYVIDGKETSFVDALNDGELLLNQKYSQSGGGLQVANGQLSLFIPIGTNVTETHILEFFNALTQHTIENTNSTMYYVDSNKTNAQIVNGSKYFYGMSNLEVYVKLLDEKAYEVQQKLINQDPVWVRLKGCSLYQTQGNTEYTRVYGLSGSGNREWTYVAYNHISLYEENRKGISDTPIEGIVIPYSNNQQAPVYAFKYGYFNVTANDSSTNAKEETNFAKVAEGVYALSVTINFAGKVAITEEDLKNVYVTFDSPIIAYDGVYNNEWHDTKIPYIVGEPVTAVELSNRIDELAIKVEAVEDALSTPSLGGDSVYIPNYWKDRLDEISPKVEELQKEYGIDAFQFLWASDVHGVPSYGSNNTTYIGNICRYMMDKHNIPFFAISGDIMSQASYTSVEPIWEEYEKLNNMLSVIEKDEFLAVKGNHDGAWGDDAQGERWLKNIGNKELFNAFYRRQTLDRKRVFGKDGTYFYIDCPNVRFYMLNTHTDGDSSKIDDIPVYNCYKHYVLGNEQLNWIANSLLTVEEGQKVIFMGHTPIKACVDNSIFTGIVTAYKDRTNYTGTMDIVGTYWGTDEKYSKVSVNKDFANAKGDLVGYFHGHIHKDTISTDGQYPVISISNAGGDNRDSYITDGTLSRVNGTPTETAIDLVTVTSDYIYFTRIGCGYDRKYNRLTKEVTIDYDSAYIN